MILTGLDGAIILPSFMILIPLRAVQEKSPLSGFTGYVYHSLPTKIPFLVSLIMSFFVAFPATTLRLCVDGIGIGCVSLPIGDPGLDAFPLESNPSLNALKQSEKIFVNFPDSMRYFGIVKVPSSSNGLLPMPFGLCGSSIKLKSLL